VEIESFTVKMCEDIVCIDIIIIIIIIVVVVVVVVVVNSTQICETSVHNSDVSHRMRSQKGKG
jgi:hypothetical protein